MEFGSFVLAAATADLTEEPAAREHADAVEFRMDLAEAPMAQLDDYAGELPLIATNRVEWDGGGAADDEARIEALTDAVGRPAVGAVDVEVDALPDGPGGRVAAAARAAGVGLIVSAHDFEGMPGRDGIRRILRRAAGLGDVAKFAGTAAGPGDALDLLAVTHELAQAGDAVATMAMGEAGRHTRAVAPVYGSRIAYAPVDPDRATAPGQFDLATLRTLLDQLGGPGTQD